MNLVPKVRNDKSSLKTGMALTFLWLLVIPASQAQRIEIPGQKRIEAPAGEFNYRRFTAQQKKGDPQWLAYNPGKADHPDAGWNAPWQPIPHAVELLEHRTATTRRFIDPENPSRIFAQSSYTPLHYQKNGEWLTLDPRLRPLSESIFEATRQPEPVGVDTELKTTYLRTQAGTISFNNWKLKGRKGKDLTWLADANWTAFTVGDDGIFITDLFPGIDAEMTVALGQIKTNLIVKTGQFLACDELIFEDHFSGLEGLELKMPGQKGVGEVLLIAGAKHFARIGKAVAYYQGGSVDLPYQIDQNQLGIRIRTSELMSMLASGPVIIDPLVVGAESELHFTAPLNSYNNADCSQEFNEVCSYSWLLEIPGGITVTDLSFLARIQTHSPCTRDKMIFKYRIGDGSCGSNVIWSTQGNPTTPGITGGVITRTSYYTECIQPTCETSYTSARISILRMCMGDAGCGAECVSGIGPFIITVEGHTLETFEVTNSTNGSKCFGEEVELGASAVYGIEPYQFRWLPGNLQGDKIKVQLEESTVFRLEISDACNTRVTEEIPIEVSEPMRIDTLERADCGSVLFEGITYTRNELLERSFVNRWGCDSLKEIVKIIVYPFEPLDENWEMSDCLQVEYEGQTYTTDTTLYSVLTNQNGCDSIYKTVTIRIENFKLDLTHSSGSSRLFVGEPVELITSSNISNYRVLSWSPPELFSNQTAYSQKISVPENLSFVVNAESPGGCVSSDSLHLSGRVIPLNRIYPDSFTPNGDGNNDVWKPIKPVDEIELWIYNRWGECIYHTTESDHEWDGTYQGVKVPPGFYVYRLKLYGRFEQHGIVSVLY